MALGIRHLAMIWESAWKAGGGASVAQSKIKKLKEADLRRHYENIKFVPSLTINTIGSVLPSALGTGSISSPAPGGPKKKTAKKKTAVKKTAKKAAKKKKATKKKKAAKKA
jgi:topoisomerase IA-like protein